MKMKLGLRNVVSCFFLRPWLGVTLGVWLGLSMVYYWWLISKVNVQETQNMIYKEQALASPSVLDENETQVDLGSFETTSRLSVIPDTMNRMCETIHIAFVCTNKCIQLITPMLKSLLHHRQNPLHFHIVVSDVSEGTLSKLFDTWDLPDVKYTCYIAQRYLFSVMWIPNEHYAGMYALTKLLFPDILPASVEQVIVIDSDIICMCDVAELWILFRNMTQEQCIGIVENESSWYLSKDSKRWPAVGLGYNTGVMLIDLKKLRILDWSTMWRGAIKAYSSAETLHYDYYSAMLADQDIFNAAIKKHPSLVYNVDCRYNVQLSIHSLAKYCYRNDATNVKIIHWNSPYKHKIKIADAEYFRSIYQSYVNFDGYLLREKLYRCDQGNFVKITYPDCISIRTAQHIKLRIHQHYTNQFDNDPVESSDVTLVLHLSVDRIQYLERVAQYWDGPVSAAVYLSDREMPIFRNFLRDRSEVLKQRWNIAYHLVYKHDAVPYPVNYLRNVALEHTRTPYLFLVDAEVIPSTGLYNHLRSVIRDINPYPQKKCLVIPAFETRSYLASPPRNKTALLSRLVGRASAGDVEPFEARELWPTNYTRWTTAVQPYEAEWQPDYEPYLVVHRSVPKYDTRYSGFPWNKMSHSVELRAQGYHLVVLPDAFVVHTPHLPHSDITAFDYRTHPHYKNCLWILRHEFLNELTQRYNVTCPDRTPPDSLKQNLFVWDRLRTS